MTHLLCAHKQYNFVRWILSWTRQHWSKLISYSALKTVSNFHGNWSWSFRVVFRICSDLFLAPCSKVSV